MAERRIQRYISARDFESNPILPLFGNKNAKKAETIILLIISAKLDQFPLLQM